MAQVNLAKWNNGQLVPITGNPFNLEANVADGIHQIVLSNASSEANTIVWKMSSKISHFKLDNSSTLVSIPEVGTFVISFQSDLDASAFINCLLKSEEQKNNIFDVRTEEVSSQQYFQFYASLSQQQNMLQDYVRTSTYQQAIFLNSIDFKDKVVLDVGAGSGILSFFAAHAGAARVYAVEASSMARHCAAVVKQNGLGNRIKVIEGKVEEIDLPEHVDVIISEPIGYMLVNERMLETFLHAKKWLKPGGKLYPTEGHMFAAPFTDEALYLEMVQKANFWCQDNFYGVNISSMRMEALKELIKQPVVDTFDIRICVAGPEKHIIDFATSSEADLYKINIPLRWTVTQTNQLHGVAFWFDILFAGSSKNVWLSTSPTEPLTHWYQVRCLLPTPLLVNAGQTVVGECLMVANARQSYDVHLTLRIEGIGVQVSNTIDLKTPYFRYTATPAAPVHNSSPSEVFWAAQQQQQQLPLGVLSNGAAHTSPQFVSLNQLTQLGGVVTPLQKM